MSFKIGFTPSRDNENKNRETLITKRAEIKPRKSVVQVHFDKRHLTCAYYNDLFDLHVGDMVYVEGKLEGMQGRVVEVSYTFKIKLSDYKKVTHLIDTKVNGDLFFAGSHAIAYEKDVIPFDKVISWFKTPNNEEDEYVYSTDDTVFNLEDLGGMNIAKEIADRGYEYYMENRVVYIEIDDGNGKAIVDGSEPYIVEFEYDGCDIHNITCSCYCTGTCKHEFAAMLQLKETLKFMDENYEDFDDGYFAIISKNALFKFALNENTPARITIAG